MKINFWVWFIYWLAVSISILSIHWSLRNHSVHIQNFYFKTAHHHFLPSLPYIYGKKKSKNEKLLTKKKNFSFSFYFDLFFFLSQRSTSMFCLQNKNQLPFYSVSWRFKFPCFRVLKPAKTDFNRAGKQIRKYRFQDKNRKTYVSILKTVLLSIL